MLQEEQIRKLTQLKELLDGGVLSEDEFVKEKAKILSNSEQSQSPIPKQVSEETEARTVTHTTESSTIVGPAYVGLSSGIVLPLGILAIIVSLIGSVFSALPETGYYDYSVSHNYLLISAVCDLLGTIAELILWVFAFNKLSSTLEGKRLGRIPLWTYLYLGAVVFFNLVNIADPEMESALGFLISLTAALVFGFMAYISLYKTYSGKMRTYSIVWMVALPLALLFALFGISFIGLIIMITIYVFLMIALLEKKNAEL